MVLGAVAGGCMTVRRKEESKGVQKGVSLLYFGNDDGCRSHCVMDR